MVPVKFWNLFQLSGSITSECAVLPDETRQRKWAEAFFQSNCTPGVMVSSVHVPPHKHFCCI